MPDSLRFINSYTPKTVFQRIETVNDINLVIEKSRIFCGKPVIIKDYVKSEKHYWDTACFVKNSSDTGKLKETINNFIELRGDSFEEGIVIREYVELNNLAKHSKSGMPLSEEYRLFFCNQKLLHTYSYWEDADYSFPKPNMGKFEEIAKKVESHFFVMDIAKLRNGELTIIELGDGQVSGLPETEDTNIFYEKLMGSTLSEGGNRFSLTP